VTRSIY